MDIKRGDLDEEEPLNNLNEIAIRVEFYTSLPIKNSPDPPKKPVKTQFNPRAVIVPPNPMRERLSQSEWWSVYGCGHLGLGHAQISEAASFCNVPVDLARISQYLKSAASKLRLPDGKKETIRHWAQANSYETLIQKSEKAAVDQKPIVIPAKPAAYEKLSDREWTAVFLCVCKQLESKRVAEFIGGKCLDANINNYLYVAAKKLGHNAASEISGRDFLVAYVLAHPGAEAETAPELPALQA